MKIGIINFPNNARALQYFLGLMSIFLTLVFIELNKIHIQRARIKGLHSEIFHHRHMNRHNYSIKYPKNGVLCVTFQGRLGNLMFQYASAYGIAKFKNRTLWTGSNDRISQVFNTTAIKIPREDYCKYAVHIFEKKHCSFDPSLLDFNKRYVKLHEYLQSWKYFENVSTELRREFRFNITVQRKAEEVFHNATRKTKYYGKNATYVGVHIRRGDMFLAQIRNETKVFGYNIAPASYIDKAISYFNSNYDKASFIICSDDIRWAIRQYGRYQKLLNLVFVHQKPEVDLAILAMCNHTIMTTGTFGWWASWLAGGTTVYYKHYIKEESELRKQFSSDFTDFFYPNWIPME